jgi:glycosidase
MRMPLGGCQRVENGPGKAKAPRGHFVFGLALLLALSCATATPPQQQEWARGAVFYEIFVRSFADSNGDGIGDFNGLTSRLDYLTGLGIGGIWLMPVFESTSYHGYDTLDYERIEKDYGTNADFQRFLEQAHERGIRVILDFVINHTGSDHPWFIESASSPSSPKRGWYVWSPTNPGWKQPWGGNDPSWHERNGAYYYGAFWSGMPDVNFRNPEAKAEMFRLARYWVELGVDGYRLDATRYLVETGPGEAGQADTAETRAVLREFAADVRRARPDAILVAENTVDTAKLATYFDSIPMNFNFPLASAIVESVNRGDAGRMRDTLREMARLYPRGIIDAPFLTNHDQTRIASVLGNDAGKMRSAAAILLTLPGMPFLYYGEEVGQENGPTSADESKRLPMPWTSVASQSSDPRSLLSHYRGWIAARKRSPALLRGEITLVETDPRIFAFIRDAGDQRALVVHNLGDTTWTGRIGCPLLGELHADEGVSLSDGCQFHLPAHTSGAWRILRP